MVESKGWNWKVVKNELEDFWKNPSVESYYLVNRWYDKKDFLDLGCGLGRHSILFGKNDFNVSCFDISEDAILKTKEWAESENLEFDYKIGDMLNLPYENESFDSILCRNVISHTDTVGIKNIIEELKRVMRKDAECYLTLGSKDSWGEEQMSWPNIDENTKLRMEEGPEYKVPHFYADYELVKELFKDFKIIDVQQEIEYFEKNDKVQKVCHYHILIKKQ